MAVLSLQDHFIRLFLYIKCKSARNTLPSTGSPRLPFVLKMHNRTCSETRYFAHIQLLKVPECCLQFILSPGPSLNRLMRVPRVCPGEVCMLFSTSLLFCTYCVSVVSSSGLASTGVWFRGVWHLCACFEHLDRRQRH